MLKNGLLVGLFVAIFYFISQYSNSLENKPVVEEDDEFEVRPVKAKRKPASIDRVKASGSRNSNLYKPEFRETKKDERNFAPEVERDERESSPVSSSSYAGNSGMSTSTRNYNNNNSYSNRSSSSNSSGSKSTAAASSSTSGGASWGGSPATVKSGGTTGGSSSSNDTSTTSPSTTGRTSGSGGASGGGGATLSCTATQGSGVYSTAILVQISCTASATIRYCISQGSCCDPSSGIIYTPGTNILMGSEDGDYCLSFEGESSSGVVASNIEKRNFKFVSGAPNLQSSHPKIQYQTTELVGLNFLTSNDFGKSNYGMGQVNFKTYDPSSDVAANGCEDVLETYIFNPSTPPSPTPSIILALLDLVTVAPGSQLEIPMRADQLDYGVNHIMSYLVDNTEGTPNYVCSTQAVTLEDFDFFTHEEAHGIAGTNQVREFSAGFSPYGFFEAEDSLYRGPAGLSGEEQGDQRLEAGLFQIFY